MKGTGMMLVTLTSLFVAAHAYEAIRCYLCMGYMPFLQEHYVVNNPDCGELSSPEDIVVTYTDHFCFSYTYETDDGLRMTYRGTQPRTQELGCRKATLTEVFPPSNCTPGSQDILCYSDRVVGTFCVCQGDLCNTSSMTRISLFTYLIPVSLVLHFSSNVSFKF